MSISNTADMFSQLFSTFATFAVVVGVVVFSLIAYLVIRYRARGSESDPQDAPSLGRIPETRGHLRTALISIGLSSIILGVLILGTLTVTNTLNTIPAECSPRPGDCVFVEVTAFRFGWNFTYANGATLTGNLTVPMGRIVVLEIVSKAEYPGRTPVFHSFGIDDFRIKKDAIPGLINKLWFQANSVGIHTARCFEYCGIGHDGMSSNVSVVSQGHFSDLCSSTTAGC